MEEELIGFSHAGVQEIGKLGLKFWRGRKGHSPFPFLRPAASEASQSC